MRFLGIVITTASGTMTALNSLFRRVKSFLNAVTLENVSVKMLAETLSCCIANQILGIYQDDILNSQFKERTADFFRVARVDKNDLR